MNVDDDHSFKSDSKPNGKIASDLLHDTFDLIIQKLDVLGKTIFFFDCGFNTNSPVNLVNSENDLARPFSNPVWSWGGAVIL